MHAAGGCKARFGRQGHTSREGTIADGTDVSTCGVVFLASVFLSRTYICNQKRLILLVSVDLFIFGRVSAIFAPFPKTFERSVTLFF